ncbi:MAG: HEPN domain-containing protein [Proteobacteria bacterium]|nr:HEPN domain-containing protein [Pseudomonadota bacterium]
MKSISAAWLSAANDDLVLILEIISNETLTHMVAFHAQQAIEKSFKALLEEREGIVPRIHTLETLLARITRYAVIDAELDLLEDLDKLYVDARYPADLGLLPDGKPTVEDAIAFNELAIYIHNKIKSVLS